MRRSIHELERDQENARLRKAARDPTCFASREKLGSQHLGSYHGFPAFGFPAPGNPQNIGFPTPGKVSRVSGRGAPSPWGAVQTEIPKPWVPNPLEVRPSSQPVGSQTLGSLPNLVTWPVPNMRFGLADHTLLQREGSRCNGKGISYSG